MGISLVAIKCPECGATLNIIEGRNQMFCTYCGAKILLHNENEFIYRSIDEAELKHAETEQMVELKRLEMLEKRRIEKAKNLAKRRKSIIIMEIIAFVMIIGGNTLAHLSSNPNSTLYFITPLGFCVAMMGIGRFVDLTASEKKDEEEF